MRVNIDATLVAIFRIDGAIWNIATNVASMFTRTCRLFSIVVTSPKYTFVICTLGRVLWVRTFQIDPGAVMERYDPILLNSIKNQSVSTIKYKEHMRTALSPEYQYFKKREGNRRSEVDFCKMISDSQQIASFWQHSSTQRP